MIRAFASNRKVRFLLVGGWNTVFGTATFAWLYWLSRPLGVHWIAVWAVAQVIAVTNAYVCNKLFVFKSRGDIVGEYLRFWASYAGISVLLFGGLFLCVSVLHFPPIPSQIGLTVVSALAGWLLHDRVTFPAGRQKE